MKKYVENGTAYAHGFDFSLQQGGYLYPSWMNLEKSQEFKVSN